MSIDTTLISRITRLPKVGEDLANLFNKAVEKSQSEAMKEIFHTFRGKWGLDVVNINNECVWFEMQVLAFKLLCK
jgi:hypothetical protein